MGRPRTQHSGHKRNLMLSGISQTRLGSLFCLLALLALFFLPLAHQCHLHALEGLDATTASSPEQTAEVRLGSAESEGPLHSHHDAASCPICQAALGSRYFTVPTPSLSSVLSISVQRFCNNAFTSGVTTQDILVTGPRAPPISL
jgi:hypothetical protein